MGELHLITKHTDTRGKSLIKAFTLFTVSRYPWSPWLTWFMCLLRSELEGLCCGFHFADFVQRFHLQPMRQFFFFFFLRKWTQLVLKVLGWPLWWMCQTIKQIYCWPFLWYLQKQSICLLLVTESLGSVHCSVSSHFLPRWPSLKPVCSGHQEEAAYGTCLHWLTSSVNLNPDPVSPKTSQDEMWVEDSDEEM